MADLFPETSPGKKPATLASLELIRGVASLGVFFHHLVEHTWIKSELFFSRLGEWGHPMVIIFFVLSGYVIGQSQQRHPRTPAAFLWARLKRIEPLYLIAVSVGVALGLALHLSPDPSVVLAHLFFLQSWHAEIAGFLWTNGPLWSLGTEMQFYLIFSLFIWRDTKYSRMLWWTLAWLALFFWVRGWRPAGILGLAEETFSLSLIWLLGNALANQGHRYALTLPQACFIFSGIFLLYRTRWGNDASYDPLPCLNLALPVAFFIHSCATWEKDPSRTAISLSWKWLASGYLLFLLGAYATSLIHLPYFLMYALLPWIVLAVAGWPGWKACFQHPLTRRISLASGKYSYALYVIHFPILIWGEETLTPGLGQIFWIVTLTCVATFFLEAWVQPRAVRFMEKMRNALRQKTGLPEMEPSR